ncbi:uncharacterized protein LOC120010155 isoform X2 [Tripterygium wilfordii]|uniref:uncharacterized protein LOC120010155 isoform X2 n=1 Tax=Tripterygium wilfordii TaxID=458696 RepID=UPI0018F7FF43|nr:uncharacterized protein LOC120010155 isoform X2 [Tripterygium wilfordii]
MASLLSLRLTILFQHSHSPCSNNKQNANASPSHSSKLNKKEQGLYIFSKGHPSLKFWLVRYEASRCISSRILSSMVSSICSDHPDGENEASMARAHGIGIEYNRVNCLVWVLHESARNFSLSVESLELTGSDAELSMAWNGKDVNEWHRRIAYLVAIYALLKMAIEMEVLLSHDRHNNPSPVREILTPKMNMVGEYIESQLGSRHAALVSWFRVVELPRISGYFIPLLKKWSVEYAGSGVAGIIVAISCCAAVGKLGPGRISSPLFTLSVEDILVELMNVSYKLVSVEKLYQLASEAGFELDFLSHFGAKVLTGEKGEELEFWIGLAQKKLTAAFHNDGVILHTQSSHKKVQADCLATLGLFSYLGRKTREFLCKMGIKDLDELVKDFLSYLECGCLFIHPELSSITNYQIFMEIVTDEIGWLDFYAAPPYFCNQEKKRSKQHAIQAEKEIILSKVFTVCYDVFFGFAHFSRSTQQALDPELLAFLLRSQSLLTVCLEDYWAAYDRSGELPKVAKISAYDSTQPAGPKVADKLSGVLEEQVQSTLFPQGCLIDISQQGSMLREAASSSRAITSAEVSCPPKTNSMHENLLQKYSVKLASTSTNIWMGTHLLFLDIMIALELLLKRLRGHRITNRERKKLRTTMNDIASLIPITILMLLPVSAVGHAAMLAAIKKYMPSLIPSPYSCKRLDVVKQLNRTKKMDVRSWSNLQDSSSKTP